jgi:Helix-turn-helix
VPDNQDMNEQPALVFDPSEFPTFLIARMMGDSVADFAKKLDVTPDVVYMLLSGKRQPSKDILTKMGLEIYYGIPKKAKK